MSMYLGSENLANGLKTPINLFWGRGLHAEMSVLPPSSVSAAPNFQKFAVTFDSDIAET